MTTRIQEDGTPRLLEDGTYRVSENHDPTEAWVFRLTVTDNDGATRSILITVPINDPIVSVWDGTAWVAAGGSTPMFTILTAASYANVVSADGPVGYWRLDEISGTTAADSAGSTPATYSGGYTLGAASPLSSGGGTAVIFDGALGSNATASIPAGFDARSETLECWVSIPSTPSKGAFVKVGADNNGYGIGIGGGNYETNGTNLLILYEAVRWIYTGVTLTAGVYHVVLVMNASGHPTVYLNGVQVYSDTSGGPFGPSAIVQIGGYFNGASNRHFAGTVDEVALYNTALTEARVQAHYQAGIGN